GVEAGETVVVTGASGGVGFALVQLVAARGGRVLAVTSPDKADLARDAGAEATFYRRDPRLADVGAVRARGGVGAVGAGVGGSVPTTLRPVLAGGGRWVIAGAVGGPVVDVDLRRLYLHTRVVVGSSMHTPAHFAALVELARTGAVRP